MLFSLSNVKLRIFKSLAAALTLPANSYNGLRFRWSSIAASVPSPVGLPLKSAEQRLAHRTAFSRGRLFVL